MPNECFRTDVEIVTKFFSVQNLSRNYKKKEKVNCSSNSINRPTTSVLSI